MFHLNNNLKKILQKNQSLRLSEQEKLRSMKELSFRKQKQIITYTKHLDRLSINEHHLINKTIRYSLEILRFKKILHDLNNTEKVEFVLFEIKNNQSF